MKKPSIQFFSIDTIIKIVGILVIFRILTYLLGYHDGYHVEGCSVLWS